MEKETILLIAIAVLAVLNTVSFGLMAYDKQCARLKKWRVPEKTLFLATACFGGLGGRPGHDRHAAQDEALVLPALLPPAAGAAAGPAGLGLPGPVPLSPPIQGGKPMRDALF